MANGYMDAPSEALLALVHPELARRVRLVAYDLTESIMLRVTQGLRTMAEQLALWQKGRDAHGNIIDLKAIVTKARPGFSYHNFGLAVDVAPDDNNQPPFKPDWNIHHPSWQRIINAAHARGLTTGATWRTFPDWPHLQLTGPYPVPAPTPEMRAMAMQPIWNVITNYYETDIV